MGHLAKVVIEVVKSLESNRRGIRLIGKLNLTMFFFSFPSTTKDSRLMDCA